MSQDSIVRAVHETTGAMRTRLAAGDASAAKRSAQRLKGLFARWGNRFPEKPISPAGEPEGSLFRQDSFVSSECSGVSANMSSSTRVRSFARIGFVTK